MDRINKNLHILFCLLSRLLFSFLLTVNLSLNFKLTTCFLTLKVHAINKLGASQLIFLLLCVKQSFSNLNTSFCIGQLKTLFDHIALMAFKDFRNLTLNSKRKNLAILYKHTIFAEETSLMLIRSLFRSRIFRIINSNITNNITIILIEVLNSMLLNFALQKRTNTIAKILNIVVNREPTIHISRIKVNAVRNLYRALNKVLSLNRDNVRNLVIFIAEEYSMFDLISSLRLTSAKLKLFKSLIVIKKNGLRTADNFTSTILRDNVNCVASPNIKTYNTIILIIKSNGTGLSIRSSTRNTSIAFKISKSLELTIDITYTIGNAISSCGRTIKICGGSLNALRNCLFKRLLSKSSIISKSSLITRIPKIALTLTQLTLNNNLSARIGKIHRRTANSLNLAVHAVHYINTFTFRNSNCVMKNLFIIIDNCMLGTRIINHLIVASDKQLFTNRMDSAIIIGIFSNYLNINTGNLRQLNSAENITALGRSHKTFSRLREHNLGAVDVALIAIFIFKDTILKALKSNRITNISKSVIILKRNNFNSSRRNIERNISALNYKDLTVYIILLLRNNNITISINYLTALCGSAGRVINTCKKILVSAKCVSLNNLSHLTRIKSKGNGTRDIDLTADLNVFREVIGCADRRTTTALRRIL